MDYCGLACCLRLYERPPTVLINNVHHGSCVFKTNTVALVCLFNGSSPNFSFYLQNKHELCNTTAQPQIVQHRKKIHRKVKNVINRFAHNCHHILTFNWSFNDVCMDTYWKASGIVIIWQCYIQYTICATLRRKRHLTDRYLHTHDT